MKIKGVAKVALYKRILKPFKGNATAALIDAMKYGRKWEIGYLKQHGAYLNPFEIDRIFEGMIA